MNWDEEDYDDDLDQTIPCKNCGRDVYDEANQCPYCGEYIIATTNPFASKPAWFQKLMILIAILTLIGFLLPLIGWLL